MGKCKRRGAGLQLSILDLKQQHLNEQDTLFSHIFLLIVGVKVQT